MNIKTSDELGLTLLELLVVLVILGLIGVVGTTQTIRYLDRAKVDVAKLQADRLLSNLDLLRIDIGRLPTQDEGLELLTSNTGSVKGWFGPYASQETLIDPWGNPFRYDVSQDNNIARVFSYGSDNKQGGDGGNTDVIASSQ